MKTYKTFNRLEASLFWTVSLLLTFATLGSQRAWSQENSIKMQFFEAAPHIYIDTKTGKISGSAYEMMENVVAPALGVKFKWKLTPIPRQLFNYETEKNIGSAWLAYTPERSKVKNLVFTANPYFPDSPGLAVLNSSKLTAVRTIDDILNVTIGYTHGAFTSPMMKDPRIKWDYVAGATFYPANFEKLRLGRIDAIYAGSSATLLYFIRVLGMEKEVRVVPLPDNLTKHYIVFSADRQDLVDKYNRIFTKMDLPAMYLNLLAKYIDTSNLRK